MVDQNTTVVGLEKRIYEATKNYLEKTPTKLRDLRRLLIPSAVRQPLTKLELSKLTDVGPQNVGKIEKDYGEPNSLNPSLKYLIKIALIFDIDMNYLCGLTDVPLRLVAENKFSNNNTDVLQEKVELQQAMIQQQKKTIELLEEKISMG